MKVQRLADALVALTLILLAATAAHLHVTDRLRLLRLVYPVEALVAQFSIACSARAPQWMAQALKETTVFSTAGQLAYMTPQGDLHHCTMGWQGRPLLSERVRSGSYFRLASLTKMVTSLAYARLWPDGRPRLDARVLDYFPSDRAPADPRVADMRVEHLLRHAAGFDRHTTPDPMTMMYQRSWCPSRLEMLYELRLDFAPGEKAVYSNLGYCLLGEIIAAEYGADFRQAAADLLGLSRYQLAFIDGPYLPQEVRYDFRNTGFFGEHYHRFFNFRDASAAFSLAGTAESFTRLVFDNRDLLAPLFTLNPESPACQADRPGTRYCYSMEPMRKGKDGLPAFAHAGNLWGSTAFMLIDAHGGVMTWASRGSPAEGSRDFEALKWSFYEKLDAHYRAGRGKRSSLPGCARAADRALRYRAGQGPASGLGSITGRVMVATGGFEPPTPAL